MNRSMKLGLGVASALATAHLSTVACGGSSVAIEDDSGAESDGHATLDGGSFDAPPSPAADAAFEARSRTPPQDGGTCGALPAQPSGPPATGVGAIFVMSRIFLGETDRAGVANTAAWRDYGLNLDGKTSTRESIDVCTGVVGASTDVANDGACGRDNAFGNRIIPFLQSLISSKISSQVSAVIVEGGPTMLVKVEGLSRDDTSYPVTASLFSGASLGRAPKFDGTDVWPVSPTSVLAGDITQPLAITAKAYVAGDTLVITGTGTLDLPIGGAPGLVVHVHGPVVTMALSEDHRSATGGTIAGVLDLEETVEGFGAVAGSISQSLCGGEAWASVAKQIRQAADILLDGTNEPGHTCTGISLGIGFEAKPALLGPLANPLPPPRNPCAD